MLTGKQAFVYPRMSPIKMTMVIFGFYMRLSIAKGKQRTIYHGFRLFGLGSWQTSQVFKTCEVLNGKSSTLDKNQILPKI